MGDRDEEQRFTIHGSVFRDKPGFVMATRLLHRVVPLCTQRSFRDGCFQAVADVGVMFTAAAAAVMRPRLAARFLAIGRQREDHRYGAHSRQVIEVVHPAEGGAKVAGGRAKLIVFVHGGAWGSGRTWMYRVMVDRLSQLGYTVASLSYRVYPEADIHGQVDDLATAMRWISSNTRVLGLGVLPEIYLMGHSSGAHVALLYLIRRAEDGAAREDALGVTNTRDDTGDNRAALDSTGGVSGDNPTALGSTGGDSGDNPTALDSTVGDTGDNPSAPDITGGDTGDNPTALDGNVNGRELEVEGFIGLSGVYDVHSHYLYESWRGVHEISPMKAANGGVLYALFDYSHPRLLGGKPSQKAIPSPSPATKHSPPDPRRPLSVADSTEYRPARSSSAPSTDKSLGGGDGGASGASGASRAGDAGGTSWAGEASGPGEASRAGEASGVGGAGGASGAGGAVGADGTSGTVGAGGTLLALGGRRLGLRLPRSLVVHGMADATVPFVQTATVGAALKALGVPTRVRFEPGGDHFGMVGQLMFEKDSTVETALLEFTSPAAAEGARKERGQPPSPIRFPHIPSRL